LSEVYVTKCDAPFTPEAPTHALSGIEFITLRAHLPYANGNCCTQVVVQRREISMYSKATWGMDLTLPVQLEDAQNNQLVSVGGAQGEGRDASTVSWSQMFSDSGSATSIESASHAQTQREAPNCTPQAFDNQSASSEASSGTTTTLATRSLRVTQDRYRWHQEDGVPVLLHIDGLTADRTYDFRIRILNEEGSSDWSAASKRCRTRPPLRPGVPLAFKVTEVYPNAAVFVWDMPPDFGSRISGYVIEQERTAVGEKEPEDVQDGDGTAPGGPSALMQPGPDSPLTIDSRNPSLFPGSKAADKSQLTEDELISAGLDDESAASIDDEEDRSRLVRIGKLRDYRLERLVTGNTYRFRMRAVNAVGEGEFTTWSPDVWCHADQCGDPPGLQPGVN